MGSKLESFLSARGGSTETATPETPSAEPETPATDVKPEAEGEKPDAAAPAPSAGQAPEQPAEAKAGDQPAEAKPDKPERERDEHGRFKAQESKPSDEVLGLRAALQATREENRRLKAGQPPPKPTSFYDDADKAGAELEGRVRGEIAQHRYAMSEAAAKTRHTDFDTVVGPLLDECKNDEALGMQVFDMVDRDPDPAGAFYRLAKNRAQLQQLNGDPEVFRKSIEEPLQKRLAELEAQLKGKDEEIGRLKNLPTSLTHQARAGAVPDADKEPRGGKLTLTQIIEPRKKRRA